MSPPERATLDAVTGRLVSICTGALALAAAEEIERFAGEVSDALGPALHPPDSPEERPAHET